MGIEFKYKILKQGFYPRGGGKVEVFIRNINKNSEIKPISIIEKHPI